MMYIFDNILILDNEKMYAVTVLRYFLGSSNIISVKYLIVSWHLNNTFTNLKCCSLKSRAHANLEWDIEI